MSSPVQFPTWGDKNLETSPKGMGCCTRLPWEVGGEFPNPDGVAVVLEGTDQRTGSSKSLLFVDFKYLSMRITGATPLGLRG